MKKLLPVFFYWSLLMTACAPKSDDGSGEKTESMEKTMAHCEYAFDPDSTQCIWTGFKFSEKVGVSGTFTNIITDGFQQHKSIIQAIGNASFKIPVTSVESNDEDRNRKIVEYFFKGIHTDVIFGYVSKMDGDDHRGTAEVMISMNGKETPVFMPYTFEDNVLTMATIIDVNDWNGQIGIDQLNEVCYDLHRGADGISRLWPEVKIEIKAVFNRICQ